jgi:DNA-binding Xre family transcriptional regulator
MEFSDVVALKIKELMQEKNISTYGLESLTGVYSSTITLFLNRKTKTIRLENLLYICEALGTNLSQFFADERFNESEAKHWLKRNKEK